MSHMIPLLDIEVPSLPILIGVVLSVAFVAMLLVTVFTLISMRRSDLRARCPLSPGYRDMDEANGKARAQSPGYRDIDEANGRSRAQFPLSPEYHDMDEANGRSRTPYPPSPGYRVMNEANQHISWYRDRLYSVLHNKSSRLVYHGRSRIIESCHEYTNTKCDNSTLPDIRFAINDVPQNIADQTRQGPLI
jgi:hypothetical protein